MSTFRTYHPMVLLVYFVTILSVCMFTVNPILLLSALLGAICVGGIGNTFFSISKTLLLGFAFCLLIALVNPLFSQNGATELFFILERAVTLESLINGGVIALMLFVSVLWFSILQKTITEDKLLYLFGRISPRLTVLISAALRFIPRFRAQHKKIHTASIGLGIMRDATLPERMQSSGREFSVLVSWSLEQAVVAGASMQARGYGLKGRSRFSLFRFTARDLYLLITLILTIIICLPGFISGAANVIFYPKIVFPPQTIRVTISYFGFGFLSMLPAIIAGKEALKWKYYRSKI